MATINCKTLLQHAFETDEEGVKWCYNSWAEGAINIAREDKPLYYFSHFVLSGINYQEFLNIIKEGQNDEQWRNFS